MLKNIFATKSIITLAVLSAVACGLVRISFGPRRRLDDQTRRNGNEMIINR